MPTLLPSSEQPQIDTGRIHELADALLPVSNTIRPDSVLDNPYLNSCLAELIEILHELHPADIAAVLESLPLQSRLLVWKLVEPESDGTILLEVSDAVRESLIENMERQEILAAVEDMDVDDLAELADDLPRQVVAEALQSLDEDERAKVQASMSFADDQVGAIMDFELVSIRADVTCEVVMRYLRRFESLPDHTDKIFVVDENDVLQGVLPIRKLLVADPDEIVEHIMARDIVRFRPEDNTEEAAQAFERYDLVTAPVTDADGKLIGRLTVDEMVDVIREETEADMLNMAGLQEDEDLFAPVLDSVKNRWMWLAINLCTAFLASRVIGAFEGSIAQIVALAALMPIVACSQALHLLRKEVGVALINGVIWGGVMGVVAWLLYKNIGIGLVMVAAMTLNLLLAATVGVLIPVIMDKLGRDPALGSSVLITAVTDSGGFLIFLGLATIFLL